MMIYVKVFLFKNINNFIDMFTFIMYLIIIQKI